MANPILAELVRNNWVENRHRGAFIVAKDTGEVVASAGDVERAIFPRSAIKSMQALALFKSGAVAKFGLSAPQIAICCASHHGETAHVDAARSVLNTIGCSEDDLECGAHAPSNKKARNDLFASGGKPQSIHNNCSGKHSGMLAIAKALGVPTEGYSEQNHPVQKLVRASLEELLGASLTTDKCGTDGCSLPTWAAPLKSFATAFAGMATGKGQDKTTAEAMPAIFDAVTSNPFLIGGSGVFDTDVMEAFEGRLVCKIGAEGVFCGAVRDLGLGFALKCDDGNMLASEMMVAKMLLDISQPNQAQREFLTRRMQKTLTNWRKLEVATMRAVV